MTVNKRKDSNLPKVFVHKVADVRGGVSVATADLNVDFLHEGRVVSAPVSGICHVIKYAKVQANASNSDVKIKVYKGHDFKVSDVVCAAEDGAAYAITAIATSNASYDEITIGTTLGVALTKDVSYIFHAKEAGASGSALKYEPLAVVGTGKPVLKNSNIDTDAWVIGVTKGNELPALIAGKLKGIINY